MEAKTQTVDRPTALTEMTLGFQLPSGEEMKMTLPMETKVSLLPLPMEKDGHQDEDLKMETDPEPTTEENGVDEYDGVVYNYDSGSEGGDMQCEQGSCADLGEVDEQNGEDPEEAMDPDPSPSRSATFKPPRPDPAPVMTSLTGEVMPITAYLYGLKSGKILPPFDPRKKLNSKMLEINKALEAALNKRMGQDWRSHPIVNNGVDPVLARTERLEMHNMMKQGTQLLDIWLALDYIGSVAGHPNGKRYKQYSSGKMYTTAVDIDNWTEIQLCYKTEIGPYKTKLINVIIDIPDDYPMSPPTARTTRTLYHPQINHVTGEFMTWMVGKWRPDFNIRMTIMEVLHCLQYPVYVGPKNPLFAGIPIGSRSGFDPYRKKQCEKDIMLSLEGRHRRGRVYGKLTSLPMELQHLLPKPQSVDDGEIVGSEIFQEVRRIEPIVIQREPQGQGRFGRNIAGGYNIRRQQTSNCRRDCRRR
jgi:ubiquitin-protein ligase